MKPAADLEQIFKRAGVDITEPMILSCGSGVTACFIHLALKSIGATGPISVYDGSFAEWGQPGLPGVQVLRGAAD